MNSLARIIDRFLPHVLIIIGALLRFADIGYPDFSTDEAQAALGVSAAWTPLGMQLLQIAQQLFGHEIVVVRAVSVLFGLATLPLVYLIARHSTEKQTALLITSIAAIFPSHILFSRLAWLNVHLFFFWVLTLYAFLEAQEKKEQRWYILLFFASVAATMTKTQGLLFPVLLIIGCIVERVRTKNESTNERSATLTMVLVCSLIPVTLYILTHPGITATVLLYGGNMYGVSGFPMRVVDLLRTWWEVLTLFFLALVLSLRSLPTFTWPTWALLLLSSMTGLILGPSHAYYTTELLIFALPIGVALSRISMAWRAAASSVLLLTTVITLGPRNLLLNPWTREPYRSETYWNIHGDEVNDVMKGEDAITVLGHAGHHLRWYLEPRVLVGKNMRPPHPTRHVIVVRGGESTPIEGEVLYEDTQLSVLRTNPSTGEKTLVR